MGLPLALRLVECGFRVDGIDSDPYRVRALSDAASFSPDITSQDLSEALSSGLRVTNGWGGVARSDIVVVCVPTPLTAGDGTPDLSFVRDAMNSVSTNLKPGALVVLESTVAPGTTKGPVLDTFLAKGLRLDLDFFLAFAPERINPGSESQYETVPRLVSGVSEASLEHALSFYSEFCDEVIPVKGTAEAEFAKLLENSYRLVNISLVNELGLAASRMGIDFDEVVRAASTKPYGFSPFSTSAGAGGHCIPVDPVYLSSNIFSSTGDTPEVLEAAIRLNAKMPKRFVREMFVGVDLDGKRVLVAGIGYKRAVADTRNSPARGVVDELLERGAEVHMVDEVLQEVTFPGAHFVSGGVSRLEEKFDYGVVLQPLEQASMARVLEVCGDVVTSVGSFGPARWAAHS